MNQYVISFGGSLIFPKKLDANFLDEFRGLIVKQVNRGDHFGIVCGGGWIAREYQRGCNELSYLSSDVKDWLGIEATRMNAAFVKAILPEDLVYSKVVIDPTANLSTNKSIVVAGGWKPGWSTDFVAVSLADNLGVKSVINMSNTNGVYDSDPDKNSDVKMFENLNWENYRALIPSEWRPGMNAPFDPVASRKADELGMEVYVINSDLKNLENLILGENFKGTTIHP